MVIVHGGVEESRARPWKNGLQTRDIVQTKAETSEPVRETVVRKLAERNHLGKGGTQSCRAQLEIEVVRDVILRIVWESRLRCSRNIRQREIPGAEDAANSLGN